MSEQVLIQFRADKELKQEVTEIYDSLGLDLPTAFRMFMARSKMVNGLPFDAKLSEKEVAKLKGARAFSSLRTMGNENSDLSLEDINAEIKEARKKRKTVHE